MIQGFWGSDLMKSPSRATTLLMIFCWGFLGDLSQTSVQWKGI